MILLSSVEITVLFKFLIFETKSIVQFINGLPPKFNLFLFLSLFDPDLAGIIAKIFTVNEFLKLCFF